jgi:hypothetical protein
VNLSSQTPDPTERNALASVHVGKHPRKIDEGAAGNRGPGPTKTLAIHLSLYSLDRLIQALVPFYGMNCPIAIYDEGTSENLIARTTLGALDGWTPPHQSLLLIVG